MNPAVAFALGVVATVLAQVLAILILPGND